MQALSLLNTPHGSDYSQSIFCRDDPSAYLSSPLHRDQDMRAVERFFLDWVMYPCCTMGVCPGYLASIPALYHGSRKNDLLHWTVQAMAYSTARMCRADDGVSFEVKARTCYGKAVQCLRNRVALSSSQSLYNDEILASILLLDQWELTYANRNTLCGSHGPILLHILAQGPNLQATSAASAPLSQAASYRLLCHLLMANEEEKLQQLSISFDWDGSALYNYMVADVFHIVELRAEIRAFTLLMDTRSENNFCSRKTQVKFADLVSRVRNFVSRPPQWVWDIPNSWKPWHANLDDIYDSAVTCDILQRRLGLPDQSVLKFHGLWVACMWASHWACLILLHDSLVDAIKRQNKPHPEAHSGFGYHLTSTGEDEAACRRHAVDIFQAIPFIMGHVTTRHPSHQPSCESGRMLARLFALFPLFVLESSPSVTVKQRVAATNIKRWLQEGHQIN